MPPSRGENLNWILLYIIVSTAFIFYIDLITPLGFAAWILYFIPMFLSLYIWWKHAPFLVAGILIILIAIAFFISPRDISLLFALFDRIVFSLMLIVTAIFIRNYKGTIEDLMISESRYRQLTMWSPETIIVYREKAILCVNPAGLSQFFADSARELVGKDLLDLVDQEDRGVVRERIGQAIVGAQMTIDRIRMHRVDGSAFLAELSLGKVLWEGRPAVQIILHDIANR